MARGMASFKEIGEAGTENFRLACMEGSSQTSWWHDVPLEGSISGTVNMVVEIPRYTLAKMEVCCVDGRATTRIRRHKHAVTNLSRVSFHHRLTRKESSIPSSRT